MSANGVPPLVEVPVTELARVPMLAITGAAMRVQDGPDGKKLLMIGPLVLGIPMTPESQKWLREQLSPIVIAAPSDLPSGGV